MCSVMPMAEPKHCDIQKDTARIMEYSLLSWNVNGIRALSAKKEWSWFTESSAGIIGVQETKAEPSQVPEEHRNPQGWNAYWLASIKKKGYSGVASFSRMKPLAVHAELPNPDFQGEGRLLHLEFEHFHYFNVYFPNGGMSDDRLAYKMGYYEAFLDYAESMRQTRPIVVCGDFNTAHMPIDLARPKENEKVTGFLPEERAWMDSFIGHGYVDTFRYRHPAQADAYSWWSYKTRARERNVGWRIDYFFVSEELVPCIRDAWIENDVYGSDHCPVGLRLECADSA